MKTVIIIAAAALLAVAPASGQVSGTGDNAPELITAPYDYRSEQGQFSVTWPSGCGELRRREYPGDPKADPFERVSGYSVSCDQNKEHGRGCAVSVVWNEKSADGGMPGPEQVIARMEEHMRTLGVTIVRQQPIGRELADGTRIEGLEIQAARPDGAGQAWLRGLLYQGDIFLLSAWKLEGGLWDDPEFQQFFDSFTPLID
ncbi:MAG TPA: hypothetical protein PLQ13_03625 [Candidatus Krumholzibacteria bacterium]|nr:hypothetical protein [Candidatus Krumholzibacteria bacterium]